MEKSCRLSFRVTPGAKQTKVLAVDDDGTVRISVAAPPADNAANEALCRYLAKALDLPKRNVIIARGRANRVKTIEILGLTRDEALARLTPRDDSSDA